MRKKVNLINAILYAITAVLWLISYLIRDIDQNRPVTMLHLLCAAVWAVGAVIWWIRWRRELE